MEQSGRRAQPYEAGIISTVEAALLEHRVGETFTAVVIDVDEHGGGGERPADDLPVSAYCEGDLPLGERVSVKLESADVGKRQVRFLLAG